MLPRDSATCSWKAGGGAPSGVLPFLSRGPRKRPPNCHQTLRRPAKLYGAPPNFTLAQQTLRRTVKLYADPPNLTACHQTLRRPSKLYGVPPNFTAAQQILRRAAKPYVGPANFTAARQTLRWPVKLYVGSPNLTATQQTLRRLAKLYGAAPNFTTPLQTLRGETRSGIKSSKRIEAGMEISLDVRWNHGSPDCATAAEPAFQVHAVDGDTFILRQSKCSSFEAPFLYLLFGTDRALLLDTGAEPGPGQPFPLREVVQGIVAEWSVRHKRSSIDLIVAHTHGHDDHVL